MHKRTLDCAARWLAAMTVVFSACGPGFNAALAIESPYSLITTESQRVHAILEFAVDTPNLQASEWIVFIAKPPSLPSQKTQSAKLEPLGLPYTEESDLHRHLFRARIPVTRRSQGKRITATSEFDAILYARHLTPLRDGAAKATVAPLTDAERTAALRMTPMFDFGATSFTEWLDDRHLHRRKRETDVDFGRRVFLAIVKSYEYEYAAKMTRNAAHLCTVDKTDCGGMSVLFAAAMRANDIPARVLSGCWAKSSVPSAQLSGVPYYQTHVKAEFFAAGVGWVPVDTSSAVLHDKSAEKTRYFGHDTGDFLTMHIDPELKVDTIHFGMKSFPWLQQFHFYATGKGKVDDVKYTMNWQVTKQ